jgi:hypothetical protein
MQNAVAANLPIGFPLWETGTNQYSTLVKMSALYLVTLRTKIINRGKLLPKDYLQTPTFRARHQSRAEINLDAAIGWRPWERRLSTISTIRSTDAASVKKMSTGYLVTLAC